MFMSRLITGHDNRVKDDKGLKSSSSCEASLAVNAAFFPLFRQSGWALAPLEFRKGAAEGHPGTKFLNRTSVHQGVTEANVKTQVVPDLPDRANQAGKGSRLPDFFLIENLRYGS